MQMFQNPLLLLALTWGAKLFLSNHPLFQIIPKYFKLFHVTAGAFPFKRVAMSEDTIISPIAQRAEKTVPVGRRADRLAMILAGLGTVLSIIGAVWFFAGFAENDSRPEHLASALALTLILFAFAIGPFAAVTLFAHRAYRAGTRRAHLLWTLFLMLPWVLLGSLAISFTPLPVWCGIIITALALLLSLWAFISLILDRKSKAQTQ